MARHAGKDSRTELEGRRLRGRGNKMDKEVVQKAKRWENNKQGIGKGRREWMRTSEGERFEQMTYLYGQASSGPVRS